MVSRSYSEKKTFSSKFHEYCFYILLRISDTNSLQMKNIANITSSREEITLPIKASNRIVAEASLATALLGELTACCSAGLATALLGLLIAF